MTLSPVRDDDFPALSALVEDGVHSPANMPFSFPWTTGSTTDYLVTRTGETGSWLGMKHHGRGIGTLMRQALCAFMFDHLGAVEVTSAEFLDNASSLAVSRKVGYTENGVARLRRRDGEMAVIQRLVVTADARNRPEYELRLRGVRPIQEFLGVIHNQDVAESDNGDGFPRLG